MRKARIGGCEYLLALLVQQQVIVAKMRARYVPVEILRLDVKGEQVGQDDRQAGRNFYDGMRFNARRSQRWRKSSTF